MIPAPSGPVTPPRRLPWMGWGLALGLAVAPGWHAAAADTASPGGESPARHEASLRGTGPAEGAAPRGPATPGRQVAALGGPSPALLAAEAAPLGAVPGAGAGRGAGAGWGEPGSGMAQATLWSGGEAAAGAFATLRAVAERLSEATLAEDDEAPGAGAPILLALALCLLAVAGGSAAALLAQGPAWRPRDMPGADAGAASPGARPRYDDGPHGFTEADLVAAAAVLRGQAPLRGKRRLPSTPLFSAAAELARARRAAGFGRLPDRIELPLAGDAAARRRAQAGASSGDAGGAAPAAGPRVCVAAAAEELAASVAAISRQVAESTRMAEAAVTEAGRTGISLQALADTAERIGEAVRLTRQIDHEANALALNATLRAARGGQVAPAARAMPGLAAQAARATATAGAEAGHVTGMVAAMEEVIGRISHIAAGIDVAVARQRDAALQMVRAIRVASADEAAASAVPGAREDAAVLDAAARVEAATQELCHYVETTRGHVADAEAAMQAA